MDNSSKANKIDMTEGPILKSLLLFALPLFIGNVFQLFYNIVDSIIIGRFGSTEELAAVASSGSLINFLVSLLVGIAAGAGIVIAQHFGARDKKRMEKCIHTLVTFGLISGIIMSIIGFFVSPILLKMMGTPESVLPHSTRYFQIYFLGVIFTLMYNVGSAIFRAVGDSRHPLYYLIIASLTNVVLDLIFVVWFDLGVTGVAIATIMAQALSATLTFCHLTHVKDDYKVSFKRLLIDKEELKKILSIGLPNGLQNSIISLANVVVQSNINSFGELAQAGCASYSKIEGFATMPSGSFSIALSNYVGQNIGADKPDRVKKGVKVGLLTSMLTTEALALLLFIFCPYLLRMFSDDPTVLNYGIGMTRHIVLGYFMLAFAHGISGVLRGAGISVVPMISMIVCWCVVRIVGIPIVVSNWNDIRGIWIFYPGTWFLSLLVLGFYYLKVDWINKGREKRRRENK